MEKKKLIIIGGGISGLIAAYEAGKKGIEAALLEQSLNVGGRLEYAVCLSSSRFQPSLYELLGELEIEPILVPLSSDFFGMYIKGKVLPLSEFSNLLELFPREQQEKINNLFAEAMQSHFDVQNPSDNLLCLRHISFAEYLKEKGFSFQTIKMLIEPLLTFTFLETIDLKKISAEYGLFHIRFGLEIGQKDIFTLEEIKIVADVLREKINRAGIEVFTDTKVQRIEREKEGFRIFTQQWKEEKEFKGEKILLALPPPCAKKILPDLQIPEGLSFASTKVFLVKGKLKFPQKYILGVPENESNLRFLFEGPYNLFYLYPYFQRLPIEFSKFFENFSIQEETELPCAFPIIAPGTSLKIGKTNIDNIFLTGDYYYYPMLETCIVGAKKVIAEIAE